MPVEEGDDLGGVLGLRVRRAHGAIQRHFSEHFSDLELTQKQISVLWLVGDRSGAAQADLARALDMDRATTMALVHSLERRGLLGRTPSTTDRRRIAFALTEEGKTMLRRAKAAIGAHEDWLKSRFSKAELIQLEALLERIYG
ncbi:MarR family winged helix-turn-helix transcriptional regulator [Sphingomonas piscis]|uniref:MarR family winged helix-turn-helix transcriptional regulator n=1 Tax=Sphingomonas piscis TaxID=2714943 RepID=UPI001FE8201F|nr:MarR family transcriptional regulator [Sphingomonas piscis]